MTKTPKGRRGFLSAGVTLGGALAAGAANAQSARAAKHKVVFQMNSPEPNGWGLIFNNVNNLYKVFGDEGLEVEIVFFSRGLSMLLKKNTPYEERLKTAADKGVVLAACQNSMRAMNVTKDDLFPFATLVDSGVAELVRKQEAGWSYLKGGE